MTEMMRAMGATTDGVAVIEIPKPTPGRGEVRVKVITATVSGGEAKVINGSLIGRFLHAKYITLPREALAAKPDDVPFHLAAAAATVSMTSLQSLRDFGRLGEGGTKC